jgi:hypothetical protein
MLAAAVGAALGYGWARWRLPDEVASAQLVGMYAGTGAILAILAIRVGALLRTLWLELRNRGR